MLKLIVFYALFLSSIQISKVQAESRSALSLRANVPSSITTNIQESKLSSTQSIWMFSSQMNSRYSSEGQKFEVEGLNQEGLETHVKKLMKMDRTIQFEVIINILKSTTPAEKPIFLKISAN